MANTTNFGWETPDDTDLVKDGALAMRTLGNAIDTSLVDLKGGTTGQVLSKNTNTDMDFVWTTPNVGDITEVQAGTGISVASGTGPIPVVTNTVATTFDAKGDLVAGTGADTFAKLTVGANNTVLTADSSTSTGLKWSAPAGGSDNFTLINTGGTALTGATTITVSGISGKNRLFIRADLVSTAATNSGISMRINSDTGTNYGGAGIYIDNITPGGVGFNGGDQLFLATQNNQLAGDFWIAIHIDGTNSSGIKPISIGTGGDGGTGSVYRSTNSWYLGTSTVSSISLISDNGNFDAGTLYVYGAD